MKTIESVLQQHCTYVHRREDGELIATCPFHRDKNPSFGYNEHTGCFYCFRCHVSGKGVLSLLRQLGYEGHELLTAMAGMSREPVLSVEEIQKINPRDVALAHLMYEKTFSWMTADIPEAHYLFGRYILPQTLEHFHVGVLQYVVRHTIFIPIFYNGLVCGYQRMAAFGEKPKYRTMKGMVTSKSVYGEQYCRGNILLCEGVTDVWVAWQRGEKNVVATLGSHMSEEQWQMIARQATGVICAYHQDVAGDDGYALVQVRTQQDGIPCVRLRLTAKDIAESTIDDFRKAMEVARMGLTIKKRGEKELCGVIMQQSR